MDTLNQATARLAEWTKSMTPATRLTAAVVLVAIVACAAWTFRPAATSGDVYLMGGQVFSSAELRDIESALGKAQLRDYQIDGARLRVPAGEQARYMAALAEEGALPADFGEYLRKAVNTNAFMMSGPRQEAQMKVAIQSELQGLINNFHGVERSFVQIAEQTAGFPPVKTVTASVGVQPSAHQKLDSQTVAAVRWIVASAWGGLKPESVTVVDMSDNRVFAGPVVEQPPSGTAPGNYAETKKRLELDWQEKIDRLLAIPGAVVMTNVEFAPAPPCRPASRHRSACRKPTTKPSGGVSTRPLPLRVRRCLARATSARLPRPKRAASRLRCCRSLAARPRRRPIAMRWSPSRRSIPPRRPPTPSPPSKPRPWPGCRRIGSRSAWGCWPLLDSLCCIPR